ncbi:MAG: hypothetical protein LBI86_00190 [Treponema sp.]|nr:hypothetical protein [Treponema sp.]
MIRLPVSSRFVNDTGNDLLQGKIHSLRKNYNYWKKFEGRELALYSWAGKPYRSRQNVICVKPLVSVQKVRLWHNETVDGYKMWPEFFIKTGRHDPFPLKQEELAANDGFEDGEEFTEWFYDYPDGVMAILHFTNFKYGEKTE